MRFPILNRSPGKSSMLSSSRVFSAVRGVFITIDMAASNLGTSSPARDV
jgi:hypothetical protein